MLNWKVTALAFLVLIFANCGGTSNPCAPNQTICNGVCVDLQTDRHHCGSCNRSCLSGQQCTAGDCVPCENECRFGETRCIPGTNNQFQSCGDPDGDTCLEWGPPQICPADHVCAGGMCQLACDDECSSVGEKACDPEGANGWRECGQYDGDDCLDLGPLNPCPAGQSCQHGECVSGCTDECSQGQKRCERNNVEVCANWDADPCLEYGFLESCPAGKICENGNCVENCKNECEPTGSRQCQSDAQGRPGYVVCGNWDSDTCLEWSPITLCQAGESCSAGQCSVTCTDECTSGQRQCVGTTGWRTCGQYDNDSCLDWSTITYCQSWEVCDPGRVSCVANCTDQCSQANSTRCVDNNTGYQTCGNWNADPCLEWSSTTSCGVGKICDPATGQCRDNCSDECTSGQRQCLDNDTYQLCGNWDGDSCLEWGGNTDCQSGYVCSSGTCSATCQNECNQAGTNFCDGTGGWRPCGYFDSDPCLDAGSYTQCAWNEQCQNGACVVVCTNDCTPQATRCSTAGNAVEVCAVDGDADPCYEWKTQLNCASGEVCHGAVCVSTTPPAKLLISKVLYDDDGTDKEYVYVEIFGPANLQLNHYSLVGINGNGGAVYVTIPLDGYRMPSDQHFVVAHTETLWDSSLVDLKHNGADLQNGPDAVQVVWAGVTVVDALGYETGAIGGEGTPAPSADYDTSRGIQYCLGRRFDNNNMTYLDTDDNSIDFMKKTYCTPGDITFGLRLAEYNTYSSGVGATPAVDPKTGAVFIPSADYFDEILPDFTDSAWFDTIPGDKSSPALSPDGAAVYVGIANGAGNAGSGLRAYRTRAGGNSGSTAVRLWHALQGTEIKSSPAVDTSGNIYVGTRGGGFVSLNPSNGSIRWTWAESNWIDSSPALGPIGSGGAQLVVFGVGGIGSGKIVALNTSDGSVAWQVTTPTGGCNGSPGIGSDGTVYIGCDDGYLYALNGATGAIKTGFPVVISANSSGGREQVKGRSVAVAPAVGGGDLIMATSAGSAVNFSVVNSAGQKNSYNFGEALSSVTITRDGGFAMVIGDPSVPGLFVLAYSPYWTLEWYDYLGTYSASAWITSSPNALHVASGNYGLVYVATADGKVYVYYGAAGVYANAGSFPKFRSNEVNSGVRR